MFFNFGCSCFTTLCSFPLNQLYVYIHCLPLWPLSTPTLYPTELGHRLAPCAIQHVSTNYLFYTWQCLYANPNLPVNTSPYQSLPPYRFHTFILYSCVSLPSSGLLNIDSHRKVSPKCCLSHLLVLLENPQTQISIWNLWIKNKTGMWVNCPQATCF